MFPYSEILSISWLAIMAASVAYLLFAMRCVSAYHKDHADADYAHLPPVTLLKPVCGLDRDFLENLRSFCNQDYPVYQLVIGVADPADPAIETINQVIREFPALDIALVINSNFRGSNRKISNVMNLYDKARYDTLIISDSDMRVDKNYIRQVMAPFADQSVGAVTCLYKGIPATRNLASLLGSFFINEWFLPSVLVSRALRKIRFCLGATMAVRRDVIERIGGFDRLVSFLADDYMLGKFVSDLGYKVILAPCLVENVVYEQNLRDLYLHELRWARTVRTVEPVGYAFSFITYIFPLSLIYCIIAPSLVLGVAVVGTSIIMRLLMHRISRRSLAITWAAALWYIPLRDLLGFAVWVSSYISQNVHWRNNSFSIEANGYLALKE